MSAPSPDAPVLITGCSTGSAAPPPSGSRERPHRLRDRAQPRVVADLEAKGCRTLALDVTDEASMEAAVDRVEAEGRRRRAGQQRRLLAVGCGRDLAMDACAASSRPTCSGCMRMTQLVLPGDARAGGRIVNISSMGANFTFPGGGAYHATKYAVEAISDALRFEVAGFGVDVVLVQPGADPHRVRQGGRRVARQADRPTALRRSSTREVARSTREAYEKGPLALLGGEADEVAKVDREGDHRQPADDPLPRDPVGAAC